jgi:hypothetical protein
MRNKARRIALLLIAMSASLATLGGPAEASGRACSGGPFSFEPGEVCYLN